MLAARRILTVAIWRFIANDGSAMAGYIAFAMLFAIFPFVILAVMVGSLLIGPEGSRATVASLVELLPPNLAGTMEPMLLDVVKVDRGSVLTLSALVAIWSSSNGIEAFRIAFDRAYGVANVRPWWLSRLIALGVVLLGMVTFIVLGIGILFGPLLIRLGEDFLGLKAPAAVDWLRYALGIATFVAFLWVLHRVLPPWRTAHLVWPGILASTLLWFAGAIGFSLFLAHAPSFTITYGALSGVIVTMLFFYLTGMVIIFGAEINASIARLAAARRGTECGGNSGSG